MRKYLTYPDIAMDQRSRELLIDMTYIDLGLIPPTHMSGIGGLRLALDSLDPDLQRKFKRKFRKFLRRSWNKHWNNPSSETKQRAVKNYVLRNHVLVPIPDPDV